MAFKTLTIKEEVYGKLLKVKGKEESFSDFLEKLAEKAKPDLMKYAGAWKSVPEREKKEWEKLRKDFRDKFNKDNEQRFKKLLDMWEK